MVFVLTAGTVTVAGSWAASGLCVGFTRAGVVVPRRWPAHHSHIASRAGVALGLSRPVALFSSAWDTRAGTGLLPRGWTSRQQVLWDSCLCRRGAARSAWPPLESLCPGISPVAGLYWPLMSVIRLGWAQGPCIEAAPLSSRAPLCRATPGRRWAGPCLCVLSHKAPVGSRNARICTRLNTAIHNSCAGNGCLFSELVCVIKIFFHKREDRMLVFAPLPPHANKPREESACRLFGCILW